MDGWQTDTQSRVTVFLCSTQGLAEARAGKLVFRPAVQGTTVDHGQTTVAPTRAPLAGQGPVKKQRHRWTRSTPTDGVHFTSITDEGDGAARFVFSFFIIDLESLEPNRPVPTTATSSFCSCLGCTTALRLKYLLGERRDCLLDNAWPQRVSRM